jgi:SH3-like domain-containing protein
VGAVPNPARSAADFPRRLALLLTILVGASALGAASFGTAPFGVARAQSGLPLPRFVSLGSAEVNLRTGPGPTYPIEWVYLRRNMPVEIVAEFDNWRKIRDWQGTVGWVHQNLLSGERYARITNAERVLLSRAGDGTPVARLMPGVIARILRCGPEWCELETGGYRGWLQRQGFWGLYPHETFD